MITGTLEQQLRLAFKHLPSVFARLAFLTALRDPYTGKYMHEGWASIESSEEIHDMLRSTHCELFDVVSGRSIPQLCAELEKYFESLSAQPHQTYKLWKQLEPYREMVPEGTCDEAKEFFVSQMRAAVAVLIIAPDWVPLREPAASRFLRPDPRPPHHLEN